MAEISIVAEVGRSTGSRASGRLRATGKVPGVLYGHGGDPVSVTVDWRSLRQALTTDAGMNALINLDVDGSSELTMIKELQRDPVKRSVIHVDFVRVSRDEAMTVDVPVVLVGEAEQVAKADGVVEQVMHQLEITAKPAEIPNEIPVDVSNLQVGDTVRVGDLTLPGGVTTDADPEEPVVSAKMAALEIPEAEEVAEGEEVEGAEEGERPAAGEAADGSRAGGGTEGRPPAE